LDPREVQLLLSDVGLRIDAIGRLHRLLSRQGGDHTVDLGAHLTEVSMIVAASFGGVTIVNRCERGCIVSAAQAGSVALIVSELITNAAKYAHPSGIPVEIALDCKWDHEGRIKIGVSDDGVGLPEGFDPSMDGGLGMRVTRALAVQLGAKFTIATSMLGLRSTLTLPA